MMPGESVKDDGLSAIEEMKRIMNEIANRLKTKLSERSGRVRRLADKFSFLVKLNSIDVEKMEHLKTLKQQCQNFANHFGTDVNSSFLYEEIIDCLTLFQSGNRAFLKKCERFSCFISLTWLGCFSNFVHCISFITHNGLLSCYLRTIFFKVETDTNIFEVLDVKLAPVKFIFDQHQKEISDKRGERSCRSDVC